LEAYLADPTPSGASCATRSRVWMRPCLSHSLPVSPTRRCVASRRRYSPERSRSQVFAGDSPMGIKTSASPGCLAL
jgi:hypothetical protein